MEPAAEQGRLDDHQFCDLETVSRVTGRPHTVERWYAAAGRTLDLPSGDGGRADWVRN